MTADERAEKIVSDKRSQWYRWIGHLGATPVNQYELMDEELRVLIAAAILDAERVAWTKGRADGQETCEAVAATLAKNWRDDDPRHQGQAGIAEAVRVLRDAERAAEARGREEEQRAVSVALGLRDGETIHDWVLRKQDECNRLRNEAIAREREACAELAYDWARGAAAVNALEGWPLDPRQDIETAGDQIADAIRDRGRPTPTPEVSPP